VYLCICLFTCKHCIKMCVCVCVCVCMCVCACIYMYVYVDTYIYIYIYICMNKTFENFLLTNKEVRVCERERGRERKR